jgi:hypothetical protein
VLDNVSTLGLGYPWYKAKQTALDWTRAARSGEQPTSRQDVNYLKKVVMGMPHAKFLGQV